MELQEAKPRFEAAGWNLMAASTDTVENGRLLKQGLGLDYPILSDATTEVSKRYRIFNLHRDGVAAPAVFLIDADGIVRWRYVGRSIDDRPSAEEILEAIAQVESS